MISRHKTQSSSDAQLDSVRIEELLKQAAATFRELCPGTSDAASIISHENAHKLAVIGGAASTLKQLIYGDSTPTPEEEKELNSLILDDASAPKKEPSGRKPEAGKTAP